MGVLGKDLLDLKRPLTHTKVQFGEKLYWIENNPKGIPYGTVLTELLNYDASAYIEAVQQFRDAAERKNDEDVIRAMDDCDEPTRLNCKRKKDGTITGDIATREQLQLLRKYVFQLLGKMVDDIASGSVEPNPYTRGSTHNACRFCPYGAVCHSASVEGRRNYRAISAERFWEDLKKEVHAHG